MKKFSRIGAGLLVLCLALCLLPLTVKADNEVTSGTCGDNLTWNLSEGTLTISGSGDMKDYNFSDMAPWYENRNRFSKLVIGENVTSIGDYAFLSCGLLKSVTIPDSVTRIGKSAFSGSNNISDVILGKNVKTVGDSAFSQCLLLNNINFPQGLESIGAGAFASCGWLTEAILPDSVISVGDTAFTDCRHMTGLTFGSGLTSIGKEAFSGCAGLTAVTIPAGITTIGDYAFAGCTGVKAFTVAAGNPNYCSVDGVLFNKEKTELLSFPAGSDITEYTTPESVVSIQGYAFGGSSKLTAVTVTDKVADIYSSAFNGCTGLKSITLGESVNNIYDQVFRGCSSLKEVRFRGNGPYIHQNAFYGVTTTAYYPIGKRWTSYSKHNAGGTITWTLYELVTCEKGHTYDHNCDPDCNVCGETRTTSHVYGWVHNTNGHWQECTVCHNKTGETPHQYTNTCDAECNVCGYIRTVTHSYSDTWSTDSEKHWHQCSVCGNRTDETAHIPGAAATETSAQTCTTCGYVLQAPLGHEHSFGAAWQTDAFSHWHVCACGAKADEGSHSWDGGTVTQPPQVGQTGTRVYACTTCGTQKSEPIDALPPETDPEPAPTEPAPTEPAPTEPAPAAPAPTEPAPAEPVPTETTPLMLRIVKSPWTWGICGGLLLLTVLLTAMLVFEKKDPEQ